MISTTSSLDDQLMAMAAHRYCLGRSSYIVGPCHEWIRRRWEEFDAGTRAVMMQDTAEWLAEGVPGRRFEYQDEWYRLFLWMQSHATAAEMESLNAQLGHYEARLGLVGIEYSHKQHAWLKKKDS